MMAIDNLFQKCQQRKDLIISTKEFMSDEPPKNFDNMHLSGSNAIGQLQIIKQCLENFASLNNALRNDSRIRETIQKKKEAFEIV